MKTIFGSFLGVAMAALLAGCGSSGGTCSNVEPCGGDIVGTWKVTSSCLTVDLSEMASGFDCEGAKVSASDFKITGDVTYRADMTFTRNLTGSVNAVLTLPAACLTVEGITLTCAQAQQVLQGSAGDGYSSVTCTGSSTCTCTFVGLPQTMAATGTYTTTGAGVLTETDQGEAPESTNYCVKGSTLSISEAGAMAGDPTITGTVTLTRQ
jgi:hypothetical protein